MKRVPEDRVQELVAEMVKMREAVDETCEVMKKSRKYVEFMQDNYPEIHNLAVSYLEGGSHGTIQYDGI